jgi:uncharacterized membrane protein YhhN
MSWLFIIAGLFAVLNWYAVSISNKQIEYFAKPATLMTLLVAYALQLTSPPQWWDLVFGLGLLFSLVGDIFLMSSKDPFVKALISFLLAHSAYIVVFNREGLNLNTATILVATAIALIAVPVIASIVSALKRAQRNPLVIPVIVYGFALGLMFWSSASTLYRPGWNQLSAGLAALGGAAFSISDSILTWDRFVKPIRSAPLLTMFTYHIAQFALTFGVLLHGGNL